MGAHKITVSSVTTKLSRYVSKELLKTLVPAFMALALIMILGFCMQLLHEGLDVVRLPGLLPPVFIYAIPLVLPPAFLTAVITVFGRLSGDNEILAMQAAGVRLHTVIVPTLLLALFFSIAATAFQFEAVPYARRRIQKLKYQALKQILLDKIALSSRTHFSFGRGHLTYDAYRNGKMINPTIMETKKGLVQTLIQAQTGTVEKDPEREGFVLFRLQNTTITRLHGSQFGSRGRMSSEEIELPLQVTPEEETSLQDVKYLSAIPLARHIYELMQVLQKLPQMYKNPDAKEDSLQDRIEEVSSSVAQVSQQITKRRTRIAKFRDKKHPQMKKNMKLTREKLKEIRSQVDSLDNQEKTLLQRIRKLQQGGGGSQAGDKIQSLQDKLKSLRAKRKELNKKGENLQNQARKIEKKLELRQDQIEESKERLEENREDKERLQEKVAELRNKLNIVQKQEEYRSAKIRIHKRLTMAWSVLLFALVGIPLGMFSRRHSIMLAFGVCFAIVIFLFYPFLIGGQIMAETGALPVAPAMWSGNITIGLVGLGLMIAVFRR